MKSDTYGNNSKSVSKDFTIYEDFAVEQFSKYFSSNLNPDTMDGEIPNQPEKLSYSNFNNSLEDINKEVDGIFAKIALLYSHPSVESYSDNVYESIDNI